MNRWFLVEERLPNDGDAVLVTYISYTEKIPRSDGVAYFLNGKWYWNECFTEDVIVEITAWMPLPPPFQAK